MASVVVVAKEEHPARAPVVIRRLLGVEPEDLGAASDQRGGVLQFRELRVEDGADRLLEESASELEAGKEFRHRNRLLRIGYIC
jgi:hypothetical protein